MVAVYWLITIITLGSAWPVAEAGSANPPLRSRSSSVPWLDVHDGKLVGEAGQAVVLRGISTHGLQWFPQFANGNALRWLRDDWRLSVVRAAMYTAPEANGFIANRQLASRVYSVVDAAIALNIYVIIDWHILSDGNPNQYRKEALAFFQEAAQRYGNVPNVLFEICNEPNGNVLWDRDIRPYALELTEVIRRYAPRNIIIVGTSTWSQDVDIAAAAPLTASNIMYALHFYAGTHTQWLRDKVDRALAKGLAVFVSEWGVSEASGTGGVYRDEADRWLQFLAQRQISWVNWNLSDGRETSAVLTPGANTQGGWNAGSLSQAGRYVKAAMGRRRSSRNLPGPRSSTKQVKAWVQ